MEGFFNFRLSDRELHVFQIKWYKSPLHHLLCNKATQIEYKKKKNVVRICIMFKRRRRIANISLKFHSILDHIVPYKHEDKTTDGIVDDIMNI